MAKNEGDHLAPAALSQTLGPIGYGGVTVHGSRSTFRDTWAAENGWNGDLAEAGLAHANGDRTRSSLSADGLPRRPQEGNGAVSRQYRVANEWLDGLGQYHGANEWLDGAISGALRT
jgi:hypothetical protein